ncbi:MAG: ABC transporter substrate-binding protein [Termitinemataceae bacterium]|nr:MAG: ABC transporter substrate-binding protein [Termitinemataceae bacterium]
MTLKKRLGWAFALLLCVFAVMLGSCKKSGKAKIMIYTSMYEDVIELMKVALKPVFPDYNIEFFYGGTGALQAKIAAEMDSGKLGCDILMVSEPSYALELMDYEMLHPYISTEAGSLDFPYDPQGYWYPVRVCNMVLAYNPEKFSKDKIPNSFYDFAYGADVRGAISMSNPLTSGTAMASVTAFKDRYGYEYFAALGKQGVMVESGSVALTKLETGECKVIQILEESVLKKRQEEGSTLEVIYPTDGTVIIPSIIAILNDGWSANRNIKAAEEITDWFLSEEGQENIVKGWMHSVRKDFSTLPYDAIPTADIKANSLPVNWENCYKQREEIRTKFQEAVTFKK